MPKILYFISGAQPTNYDRQVAASLVGVQYRNVAVIKAGDPAEDCDGVMGVHIPQQYSSKPSSSSAMTAYRSSLVAEAARDIAIANSVHENVAAEVEEE